MKWNRTFDPLEAGLCIAAIACALSGHYGWGITLAALCGTLKARFYWGE